jgi:hypothetical protein
MGRRKVPEERKVVVQTIRLEPEIADAVCRYALKHDISVYKLLGNVVTKVFAKQVYRSSGGMVYREVVMRSSVHASVRPVSSPSSKALAERIGG